MYELKNGSDQYVIVRLVDYAGKPVYGISSAVVSGAYVTSDGSQGALTIAGNWTELTTGAWANMGAYRLTLPSAMLTVNGPFAFMLKHITNAFQPYFGQIKIVANEEADTYTLVRTLLDYSEGRWKIHTTGADANKLIFYHPDGSVLKKFNLFKADGTTATSTNPYERVPV